MKIDRRRHYVLVVDTETTNTLQETVVSTVVNENGEKEEVTQTSLCMDYVLVYDCGWQVVDTRGNVYKERSFVNRDIFIGERELMKTAYYANKIPQYVEDLRAGRRKMSTTYGIRKAMLEDLQEYGIKEVVAHNAHFDWNALNQTRRYVTKSAFRYWFPYEIEIWDTMRMANSVICKMPSYKEFCEKHNYFTPTGQLKKSAEVLYRFISGNNEFTESHTGLEDVAIEAQIMAYCIKQHKAIEKELFPPKKQTEPPTQFQKDLSNSLKKIPVIAKKSLDKTVQTW